MATKPRRIITAEGYECIHQALPNDAMQLRVETVVKGNGLHDSPSSASR